MEGPRNGIERIGILGYGKKRVAVAERGDDDATARSGRRYLRYFTRKRRLVTLPPRRSRTARGDPRGRNQFQPVSLGP